MTAPRPDLELRHILAFRREKSAAAAARALRAHAFAVEGEPRQGGWHVVARSRPDRYDETSAARFLSSLASALGGRYDGSVVAPAVGSS